MSLTFVRLKPPGELKHFSEDTKFEKDHHVARLIAIYVDHLA
jgi:hypothetical protein